MSRGMSLYAGADDQQKRFQMELEFVQCLANPNYLNYLAQRGTFREPTFINYLKYLMYWKEPEYAKYLKFPQCLHMLDLLQYESFRLELMHERCAKFIEDQQLLHWHHHLRVRMKLMNEQAENVEGQGPRQNTAAQVSTSSSSNQSQQQSSGTSQAYPAPLNASLFNK